MSLILAIEPDRRQASQLADLIRGRLSADLVHADTTESALTALASIGDRVPDLVLVPSLLSPQEDAAIAGALRVIAAAANVRMLTIPLLADPEQPPAHRGIFARFRGRAAAKTGGGCDPAVFADQIAAYLAEAEAERRAQEADDESSDMLQPSRVQQGGVDTSEGAQPDALVPVSSPVSPDNIPSFVARSDDRDARDAHRRDDVAPHSEETSAVAAYEPLLALPADPTPIGATGMFLDRARTYAEHPDVEHPSRLRPLHEAEAETPTPVDAAATPPLVLPAPASEEGLPTNPSTPFVNNQGEASSLLLPVATVSAEAAEEERTADTVGMSSAVSAREFAGTFETAEAAGEAITADPYAALPMETFSAILAELHDVDGEPPTVPAGNTDTLSSDAAAVSQLPETSRPETVSASNVFDVLPENEETVELTYIDLDLPISLEDATEPAVPPLAAMEAPPDIDAGDVSEPGVLLSADAQRAHEEARECEPAPIVEVHVTVNDSALLLDGVSPDVSGQEQDPAVARWPIEEEFSDDAYDVDALLGPLLHELAASHEHLEPGTGITNAAASLSAEARAAAVVPAPGGPVPIVPEVAATPVVASSPVAPAPIAPAPVAPAPDADAPARPSPVVETLAAAPSAAQWRGPETSAALAPAGNAPAAATRDDEPVAPPLATGMVDDVDPMFFADSPPQDVQVPTPRPTPPERQAWVELIDSLRQDIQRLRAEREHGTRRMPDVSRAPAGAVTREAANRRYAVTTAQDAAGDLRAANPRRRTARPVQDQWGLFDPEQCGFAALRAKLDEISVRDEVSA